MNPTIIKLTNSSAIVLPGTEFDRGCVQCKEKALDGARRLFVVDSRGRYWHAQCAGDTLAEFTRVDEDRGESFHYERSFPSTEAATRPLRIAFDIGGVLSKYPDQFRALTKVLVAFAEVHVITDMHNHNEVCETLRLNGFSHIPPENVHCADFATHGEGCKAELLKSLNIDMFSDDFIGYVAEPSDAIRLLVMPDATKPYWHETWKTVSGEAEFGRRVYHRTFTPGTSDK